MYVWYGTNEYNWEKLENPPKYEPEKCKICGRKIDMGKGGYSRSGPDYLCWECVVANRK